MSYTREEKREAIMEQNRIINESGLSVVDMEESCGGKLFWPVVLICFGLVVIGVCLVVYGV